MVTIRITTRRNRIQWRLSGRYLANRIRRTRNSRCDRVSPMCRDELAALFAADIFQADRAHETRAASKRLTII